MDGFTISEDVALLRLEAGKANAMSRELLDALDALLTQLEASAARAAVVTGYDRFFSAGLALPSLIDLDRASMRDFIGRFSQVMARVFAQPLPMVAAVNGHAIAGGCVLALMCDWRVMSEGDFKIGLNEVQLGIGLPSVVLEPLRLQLPPPSLLPLALEGRLVAPHEALELELLHEVVPATSLIERATARARELAAVPSSGFAQVKAGLRRPAREAMERLGADEAERWLDSWFSPAARERLTAAVARLKR
jgi:enoyl-CoA hydratase/carnithine racemase